MPVRLIHDASVLDHVVQGGLAEKIFALQNKL